MGERSTSGVRNMLAMFEAKKEETSPPSRGRSPALSDATGPGSRPISKVRASFVAVERSGQMGPMVGLRKTSDVDSQGGGARTPSLSAESRSHGLDGSAVMDTPSNTKLKDVKEEESTGNVKASPGRPKFGERVSSATQAFKNGTPGKGTSVETDKVIDLGTVLKGSPFESESGAAERPKTPMGTKAELGGKSEKTATKTSPVKAAVKKFGDTLAATQPNTSTKPTASRPSAISTRAAPSSKSGSGPQSAKSTKSDQALKTPTTPKDPSQAKTASSRQSSSKVSSSKSSSGPKDANKTAPAARALVRKTSRLSLASSKDAGGTTSASKQASPAQHTSSRDTRAAKSTTATKQPSTTHPEGDNSGHDGESYTNRGRAGGGSNILGDDLSKLTTTGAESLASAKTDHLRTTGVERKTSTATRSAPRQSNAGIRPKASRQSLAASTTSHGDRPGSRASTIGKGQDQGFLARMMRPTQSSASKTHGKADSPPRKTATDVKPKRKSDVSKRETTKPVLSKTQEKLLGLAPRPQKGEKAEVKDKKTAIQKKPAASRADKAKVVSATTGTATKEPEASSGEPARGAAEEADDVNVEQQKDEKVKEEEQEIEQAEVETKVEEPRQVEETPDVVEHAQSPSEPQPAHDVTDGSEQEHESTTNPAKSSEETEVPTNVDNEVPEEVAQGSETVTA